MYMNDLMWLLLSIIIIYSCTLPMWGLRTQLSKIVSHDSDTLEHIVRENTHLHEEIVRLNDWLNSANLIPEALDAKKQSVEHELERASNSIVKYANMLLHCSFARDVLRIRLEMIRKLRDIAKDKVLAQQGDGIQLDHKARRALMPPVRQNSCWEN